MKTRRAGHWNRRRSFWKPKRPTGREHLCPHLRRLGVELLEDRRLLDGAVGQQAIELFRVSPALFVENQGQWADESVRFLHQGDGVNVAMTDAGPVFELFQREAAEETEEGWLGQSAAVPQGPSTATAPTGDSLRSATSHSDDDRYEYTQIPVHFDGANTVVPVGLERAETRFNYFIGDQENWHSEVPGYEVVTYPGLYDGIDLKTWGKRSHLKYEFHVAPGADYRQIQLSYEGIDRLWLDDDGAMHVQPALASPLLTELLDTHQRSRKNRHWTSEG